MARILVDNLHIGYSERGDGAALVFLHGVGSDKSVWDRQIAFFSKQWRAVALDYPGYGESDLPTHDLDCRAIAGYVSGALDAIGIAAAHLVGLSMGGVIALEIARQQPDRLRSLTLADTFAHHPDADGIVARSRQAIETMPMRAFACKVRTIMSFDTFIIQLTNGLVFSLLLFLMAAGLSLIFGLMDVVNLAHGTFYLLGGYVGLTVIRWTDNFWLALLVTPLVVGSLGLLLEITLLRRLYRRGHLDQVLFTFGAALIGTDLMRWIWGAYVETVPTPALLAGQVDVMGIAFPIYRLIMIGLGLAIAAALWLVIERSRIGAIVRAGVSDAQMVSALGINIERVFAGVFAVGSGLAALSGVAAGPIVNVYPGLDFEILILAMVVVVVGGLGTLKGAFWGSLLIGMADTFGKSLLPQFSVFVIFVIMAVVLLVRPAGLFGRSRLGA